MSDRQPSVVARLLSDYGMLLALLLLCAVFSVLTWTEQQPEGAAAGRQVGAAIRDAHGGARQVVVLAQATQIDTAFVAAVQRELVGRPFDVTVVQGDPRAVRQALVQRQEQGVAGDVLAVTATVRTWPLIAGMGETLPGFRDVPIVSPQPYSWPTFLKADNLLNVANQVTEIAIVAVGMTIVIIAGGIDLSVGSLIALSAMIACLLIERVGGGREAGTAAMTLSSLAAVGVCGVIGALTGVVVTLFRVPSFVVTLGVMLAASGLAGMLTGGEAAHQVPASFTWLASGTPLGLSNAILLMLAMYAAAHVLMTRTRLGRHIYAVGGNRMAAHLSGIPTHRVLLFAFTLSAVTAGLAGVVMASRLKSANPTFGKSYELYVIAAVVVGGTSLSGGSGKVLGTLIGAFIIAVMQNGMNLLNGMKILRIDDFTQDVVLGAVLLAAVVLDQVKRQGLKSWRQLP
jgi:ribose transport system permease protein